MRLKLDLHDIYNKSRDLDRALHDIIDEAEATKAKTVEIIPGKGSGALKNASCGSLIARTLKPAITGLKKTVRTLVECSCISNTES